MATTPNPYSFQHSLGIGGTAIVKKEEGGNLTIKFEAAALYNVGQVVKLASDGTIAAVTAVTDKPIGIVKTTEEFNGAYFATAYTPFCVVLRGEATAAISAGANVSAGAFNNTTKLQEYTTAVVGNASVGIALTAAIADGNEILVAVDFNYALPLA